MNLPDCAIHKVPFVHRTDNNRDWWSHELPDGEWCNYKEGPQKRAQAENLTEDDYATTSVVMATIQFHGLTWALDNLELISQMVHFIKTNK